MAAVAVEHAVTAADVVDTGQVAAIVGLISKTRISS